MLLLHEFASRRSSKTHQSDVIILDRILSGTPIAVGFSRSIFIVALPTTTVFLLEIDDYF
jgi:hypothetical protein